MKNLLIVVCLLILSVAGYATDITVRSDVWNPFNGDPNCKSPGYVVDILVAIFEAQGHKIDYQVMGWDESTAAVKKGTFDCVIGARDQSSFQYASRMPGKKFLQWFAGYLLQERPPDINSGLRIFRKMDAVNYFAILPNGFSFSTTITLAMLKDAFNVGTIPIQTKERVGRRSTVKIKDGLRTLMLIVRIGALFNPLKVFLPVSLGLFFLGACYALLELIRNTNIPDSATLLILASVIVFFFGVLSDQLAALRRGR